MRTRLKELLNGRAVEIEFLVISIIQGFALQMLAVSAINPLSNFQWEYWPYIGSAFILILLFWTQSILHTLSFIRWPIDLPHTFLYFLACFVEVLAFQHITNPSKWFLFGFVFLIVTTIMYIYDLSMIKKCEKEYRATKRLKQLYRHMYTEQVRDMKLFVPGALLFNLISSILVYVYPHVFLTMHYHLVLSIAQLISSVVLLLATLKTFSERSKLLT